MQSQPSTPNVTASHRRLRRTDIFPPSASGLGRATASELIQHGGNVSILDLNEETGAAAVKELGGESKAKFFVVDVTDTESIAAAVKGTVDWVSQTRKPLGGIVPAAGVGNPGLVCSHEPPPSQFAAMM